MEQQRRVRIYDRKYSKASSPDKEAFLEKNVISGTKETMKKRETKDKITKVLRKISSSFKLDELFNVDQNLKKEILKKLHTINKREESKQKKLVDQSPYTSMSQSRQTPDVRPTEQLAQSASPTLSE